MVGLNLPIPLAVTPHSPLPPTTSNLLSVSMDLPILPMTYKWKHTVYGCDRLLSLSTILSTVIHVVAHYQ